MELKLRFLHRLTCNIYWEQIGNAEHDREDESSTKPPLSVCQVANLSKFNLQLQLSSSLVWSGNIPDSQDLKFQLVRDQMFSHSHDLLLLHIPHSDPLRVASGCPAELAALSLTLKCQIPRALLPYSLNLILVLFALFETNFQRYRLISRLEAHYKGQDPTKSKFWISNWSHLFCCADFQPFFCPATTTTSQGLNAQCHPLTCVCHFQPPPTPPWPLPERPGQRKEEKKSDRLKFLAGGERLPAEHHLNSHR